MAQSRQQDDDKRAAAYAALREVKGGMKVGLGSGSTANMFIEELGKRKFPGLCVASSKASEEIARKAGLKLTTLDSLIASLKGEEEETILDLYVDGADEVDKSMNLIKGGGGAHTREKVVASAAAEFICIVDESKLVSRLGTFPLPVEVVPYARSYVSWELGELGAKAAERPKFVTDNGNVILDAEGLDFKDPLQLETELNNIPGVVENGIFAVRQPERVIVGRKGKAEYL